MKLPILNETATSRTVIDQFGGYNHNIRIGENEFFDMKNMTSSYFPALSPRGIRGIYASPTNPKGMIAKDALCYVDGGQFIINGYPVQGLMLNAEPKKLVSMGAYVIILPDKKYVNTADITDFGSIEASVTTSGRVSFELCKIDGTAYSGATVSQNAPSNPANGALWIDTSSTPHSLKQYSTVNSMWASIATTYIKISALGIGQPFKVNDGVTISGVEAVPDLNSTTIIWERGDNYIVVTGILDAVTSQTHAVTASRKMPNMDFVTESGNRLWGCRYGMASNGEVVNEIYASKLGDFKNWSCFAGISTDSYAATVGTDGVFTGATTHLGYPIFFKENCFHKVYGNFPANFQIVTTACRGVQRGCADSLAVVNEVLYYKSRTGICAFDGSLPKEVSMALGEQTYSNAVAGAYGNKYYVSMKEGTEDQSGEYALFVFDTSKGFWHKEDGTRADAFCACRNELYYIDHADKKIKSVMGSGEASEDSVTWRADTGAIGTSSPDSKYISKLGIRMSLALNSCMNVYIEYDSFPGWEYVCTIKGTSLKSFTIPIRPRRCDHFRLRFDGEGEAKIYSVTKTVEEGSDG